ncbi:MAG: hypothetical protein ACXIU7_07120 [Roseinatronobacter sp.]
MRQTDTTPAATQTARAKEPWGIWAGIAFVLLALVLSVLGFGVAGLVVVMVPAAIAMLALLMLVVRG